jgi:internalin A
MTEKEILRIIEQAKEENWEKLDLGDKGIEVLPKELGNLSNLTELYLSGNRLMKIPIEIGNLSNLKKLYLSSNDLLSFPKELCKLSKLEDLKLHSNRLSLIPKELVKLSNLRELDLSSNQLVSFPVELCELSKLTRLDLNSNQLASFPIEIERLSNLKELDLSSNQLVSFPVELCELSKLTRLVLNSNQLASFPIELDRLSNLRELNLSSNQLVSFPVELCELSMLTRLDLNSNQLASFPIELDGLSNLRELDLSFNQLVSFPVELCELSKLTRLDLNSNQLASFPIELEGLSNLRELYLSSNQLVSFPAELCELSKLTRLDLNSNQLASFPKELGRLSNLRELYLSVNQLVSFPAELCELSKLTRLVLNSNQLASFPIELERLSNLKEIDLSSNQLKTLPIELGMLSKLELINFESNLITDPSPEILDQGVTAILDYLRAKARGKEKQWTSKLVVVGQGGVGKTQTLRRLLGKDYNPKIESTHGIEISPLKLFHPKESGVEMELKAWDFGGQEIYHATHQFFFSNRSLFILVWNAVHEYEQGKLFDWLDNIKAIAPESPVLIVGTHVDQRPLKLPFTQLQSKYPQIRAHFGVSNRDNLGFDPLRLAIAKQASQLPHMGQEWPKSWVDSAKDLRKKEGLFISRQEIPSIFERFGVIEKEIETLLRALHELGDILYFYEDDDLKDTIILKPQWVSKEVGKVLDCSEVEEEKGVFKREHMERLWKEIPGSGMRDRLLQLMQKFDLSYQIYDFDDDDRSLVVELLPLELNDYIGTWDSKTQSELNKELSMKFCLNTIPPGIPTWFIARSHRFTTGMHWLTGAIFKDRSNNWALIEADTHKNILTLTVRGAVPHSFFVVLRDGLELTLERYTGLEIQRRVPCPGHEGKQCVHEFDFLDITRAFEKSIKDIQCPKTFEMISTTSLILGWEIKTFEEVRDKPVKTLINALSQQMQGRFDEVNSRFDGLGDKVKNEWLSLMQLNFIKIYNAIQSKEEQACPNVFLLKDRGKWWTKGKFSPIKKCELQLFCQAPGEWHAVESACFQFDRPVEWFTNIADYINKMVKIWKFVAPLVSPELGTLFGKAINDPAKESLVFMENLTAKILDMKLNADIDLKNFRHDNDELYRLEESDLLKFRRLLDEIEPDWRDKGLKRILTPEGHYLWLCDTHADEYRTFRRGKSS